MALSDDAVRTLLEATRTIAVVGLSDNPDRDSHAVAEYLQRQGYRILPVNPRVTEVLGERAYPDLASIPSDLPIDLVDIFRRSEEVPPVVDQAIARAVKGVWMQVGVENPTAAERARASGIEVVENRCIRTEHRRLGVSAKRAQE